MAQLAWDAVGSRFFETGIDRCVFYAMDSNGNYPLGVAWNGIVSITESPSGAESNPQYADNIKYLDLQSAEEFGATVEAFTYPKEFGLIDGTVAPVVGVSLHQQARGMFGLTYRTRMGNDILGDAYGYKLHILYGCKVAPSERANATVNDSPEPITFSWELTTTPVLVTGYRALAKITIDSKLATAANLADLEEALYGTDGTPGTAPYLPLPGALITMMTPA